LLLYLHSMENKKCLICNNVKSIDSFYKNKLSKDGIFKICKICSNTEGKKRRIIKKNERCEQLVLLNGEFFKEHESTKLMVSNFGRIYRDSTKINHRYISKFLKKFLMKNGYYAITFLAKKIHVHRLVAETFIDNIDKKTHVNHIDNNKLNNNINNLEWCTHKENIKHATFLDSYSVKLNRLNVVDIRNSNLSTKDLSIKYNVSKTNIQLIKKRKIWKHI